MTADKAECRHQRDCKESSREYEVKEVEVNADVNLTSINASNAARVRLLKTEGRSLAVRSE